MLSPLLVRGATSVAIACPVVHHCGLLHVEEDACAYLLVWILAWL